MSSPVDPQTDGVAEISAHEAAEQARVQNTKNAFTAKEAALKKQYDEDAKRLEAAERAAASAELQTFGAEEIPRILQSGETAREAAVSTVETHARAKMPSELKTIVARACSHSLSF